jgi:hypothetical protein
LDHNHLFSFLIFRIIKVKILVSLSLLLFVQFFDLSFLIVGSLEGSNNTLPTSLDFLNDTDGCFHISIKCWSFFNNFLFWKVCFLEVYEKFIHNLISLQFIYILIVDEIARDVHLDFWRAHTHLQQEFIQIDVLWSYGIRASIIANEIDFELDYTKHGRFKHIFEEHSFLWVHHLIVAIFKDAIAMDIFDVEMCIKSEPFLILALVFQLNRCKNTPFSPRFSSSGSNYSWIFSSSSLIASFQRLL